MAEITAHLRRGRMTAYIAANVPAHVKDWIEQRAQAEVAAGKTGVRRSDVLRWLVERDRENGMTPTPGITIRQRRPETEWKYISIYVHDEQRDWLDERTARAREASGLPIKRSDMLLWIIEQEMNAAPTAPRKRSRREILAS